MKNRTSFWIRFFLLIAFLFLFAAPLAPAETEKNITRTGRYQIAAQHFFYKR